MGFPSVSAVKNLPVVQEPQETWVQSLRREDPLEEKWQPTPVFLPGESPWTEEFGGLQSVGSQRVRHNLATNKQQRGPDIQQTLHKCRDDDSGGRGDSFRSG